MPFSKITPSAQFKFLTIWGRKYKNSKYTLLYDRSSGSNIYKYKKGKSFSGKSVLSLKSTVLYCKVPYWTEPKSRKNLPPSLFRYVGQKSYTNILSPAFALIGSIMSIHFKGVRTFVNWNQNTVEPEGWACLPFLKEILSLI